MVQISLTEVILMLPGRCEKNNFAVLFQPLKAAIIIIFEYSNLIGKTYWLTVGTNDSSSRSNLNPRFILLQ